MAEAIEARKARIFKVAGERPPAGLLVDMFKIACKGEKLFWVLPDKLALRASLVLPNLEQERYGITLTTDEITTELKAGKVDSQRGEQQWGWEDNQDDPNLVFWAIAGKFTPTGQELSRSIISTQESTLFLPDILVGSLKQSDISLSHNLPNRIVWSYLNNQLLIYI